MKISFLEQGLLGLAFAPDFAESGEFYVYYTDERTNGNQRIVRYTAAQGEPQVADPESAELVLEIAEDPYRNHNGGNLAFGPDGYLYWSTGDGGLAGDPFDNAQDISNLYGIIGRIDVSPEARGPSQSYAIPEDNPFAQSSQVQLSVEDPANYHPEARPEIWAYGLRNPWQFSFDPLPTATCTSRTSARVRGRRSTTRRPTPVAARTMAGTSSRAATATPPSRVTTVRANRSACCRSPSTATTRVTARLTGLGVHRAETSAVLDGMYFVSDFCSGRVWAVARDDGGTWQFDGRCWTRRCSRAEAATTLTGTSTSSPVAAPSAATTTPTPTPPARCGAS